MNDSDLLDQAIAPGETALRSEVPAAPLLSVSTAPHTHSGASIQRMMLYVIAALVPAAGLSVALYGFHVILLITAGTLTALTAEWAVASIRGRKPAMPDAGAALTGLLLSLSLPAQMGLWGAVTGSLFAIIFVKIACGGLGRNFLNPALAGRAFVILVYPAVFAKAGELSLFPVLSPSRESILNLLLGYQGGWLGSASVAALLAGAIALWLFRITDFFIPVAFLAGAFFFFWISAGAAMFHAAGPSEALCRIMSGGLPLVALFMATDPVTSPMSMLGRILFGLGCGIITFVMSRYGSGNDAAMYAVLVMNLTVPYFNKYIVSKPTLAGFRRPMLLKPEANTTPVAVESTALGQSLVPEHEEELR